MTVCSQWLSILMVVVGRPPPNSGWQFPYMPKINGSCNSWVEEKPLRWSFIWRFFSVCVKCFMSLCYEWWWINPHWRNPSRILQLSGPIAPPPRSYILFQENCLVGWSRPPGWGYRLRKGCYPCSFSFICIWWGNGGGEHYFWSSQIQCSRLT